jgi:hypothetical protein
LFEDDEEDDIANAGKRGVEFELLGSGEEGAEGRDVREYACWCCGGLW